MAHPSFRHIHCSSRFDRSAASLEADIDDWIGWASLITLTEITTDSRAAQMAEKGWGYFNSKRDNGSDNCGVMWELKTWKQTKHWVVRLNKTRYKARSGTHYMAPIYAISVLLRHKGSGHSLLVCCSHLTNGVPGTPMARALSSDQIWNDRKKAFQEEMNAWSGHVKDLASKVRPDAVIVVADWNVNLKNHWIRNYLRDHWGKAFRQAWKRFPTDGGSLHGQQVVPLGAPGKGHGDSIIDGTLYHGLEVTIEPNLMAAVRSSDHRPYREAFQFNHAPGTPAQDGPDYDAYGDLKHGKEWWGFGDYLDDELYMVDDGGIPFYPDLYARVGSEGGEVL